MMEEIPHKWVIEIAEPMTAAEAQELGKAIGKAKHTARFIDGDEASLVIDGARWRKYQQGLKGGDS